VFRPRSLALLLALGCALVLAHLWDGYQMESAFGRAVAEEACAPHLAAWTGSIASAPPLAAGDGLRELRVVTYNLRYGIGPRWRPYARRQDVERNLRGIARAIAGAGGAPVDVVGLNEVDFGSRRSGWVEQAEFLATELKALTGYTYFVARGETWQRRLPGAEVRFGNAALVRHPVLAARNCMLGAPCEDESPAPGFLAAAVGGGLGRLVSSEPRGVLRVRIDFHGHPLDLLVTHLEAFGLARREDQAAEVLSRFVRPGATTLLIGDINGVPTAMTRVRPHKAADRTHDILTSGILVDARVHLAARIGAPDLAPWATYPAHAPQWPLDAVFATPDLAPLGAKVIGGLESDHRGLLVRYIPLSPEATEAHAAWHDGMRRHQLERIVACDLPESDAAHVRRVDWLKSGTRFLEVMGEGMPLPGATPRL
jgi:endonuclease/exonuclease/phosphatase family metal-dependent hydrolase